MDGMFHYSCKDTTANVVPARAGGSVSSSDASRCQKCSAQLGLLMDS